MLQRNEIGTHEHILTWLASKDEAERFEWLSEDCPAGQYAREFELSETCAVMNQLNDLAHAWPHTWGALHARAYQEWT